MSEYCDEHKCASMEIVIRSASALELYLDGRRCCRCVLLFAYCQRERLERTCVLIRLLRKLTIRRAFVASLVLPLYEECGEFVEELCDFIQRSNNVSTLGLVYTRGAPQSEAIKRRIALSFFMSRITCVTMLNADMPWKDTEPQRRLELRDAVQCIQALNQLRSSNAPLGRIPVDILRSVLVPLLIV